MIKELISKSLNKIAWDGKWFIRAITDDKTLIGSNKNEECKIDGIAQSWSVISNAVDKEKQKIAMEEVYKYLVDKDEKIVRLLYPAFIGKEYNPGYISKYKEGIRENGGQYTHGAIWTAMAFAIMQEKNRAFEIITMLNPINHTKTKMDLEKYQGEPYVLAGDVYTNKDMIGRARLELVYWSCIMVL